MVGEFFAEGTSAAVLLVSAYVYVTSPSAAILALRTQTGTDVDGEEVFRETSVFTTDELMSSEKTPR